LETAASTAWPPPPAKMPSSMYLFATAVIDVSISLYCLFDDPTEVASWCRDPEQRRRQEAGDGAGRCSFFSVGDRAQVAEIRIRDDNTKEAEQEDARFFFQRGPRDRVQVCLLATLTAAAIVWRFSASSLFVERFSG
jgi:hypothetical protein